MSSGNSDEKHRDPELVGAAIKQFMETVGKFAVAAHQIGTAIAPYLKAFTETAHIVVGGILKVHDSFVTRLAVYPEFLKMIPALAKEGWFVSESFALSQMDELAQGAANKSLSEVESHLASLYRSEIGRHVEMLLANFPHRTFLINPAFAAHQRRDYAVSVPLFYILADGICFELAAKEMFHGKDADRIATLAAHKIEEIKANKNESVVGNFYDQLSESMWTALQGKLPIGYTPKDREKNNYSGLNRNTIMHGMALEEYAIEINSLKAFSLLSHLASLLIVDGPPKHLNALKKNDDTSTTLGEDRN